MKRLNFTLDEGTIELLENISKTYYDGNKSQTVRAALESLATHIGHDGWVVAGYSPTRIREEASCHTCSTVHKEGEVLFRPVFERGRSPKALEQIPSEHWLECPQCAEQQLV